MTFVRVLPAVCMLVGCVVVVACQGAETPISITTEAPDLASLPTNDVGQQVESADVQTAVDAIGPDVSDGEAFSLPDCAQPLAARLSTLSDAAPGRGSEAFSLPSTNTLQALSASIEHGANGRLGDAANFAAAAGYEVCNDPEVMGLITWLPLDRGAGRALVALHEVGEDDLVLEHPHPLFDGTLDGAATGFFEVEATAMLIAGAHRCSSSTPSSCDGTTSVCTGTAAPYPESDPAHSTETTFHAAHRALETAFPEAVFVSLHGTAQDVAYVSDGTRGRGASDNLVRTVVEQLSGTFPDIEARSCDEYDASIGGPWLCGTSNVQGRHLNGSEDACRARPQSSGGRFLHLEQPRTMRGRPVDVARALADALSR